MPAFDVIVCGSLHLDIMLYAPALPRPDETVAGKRGERKCGGKGGNQAVMAARAGARTAMIGRTGADDFGAQLRAHLAAAGVDHSAVTVDGETGSGISAAIVQDDGDYGAVIVSGSNLRIDPRDAALAWAELGGARVQILQNETPEAVNIAVAAAARADGAKVALNAAPARAMSDALLRWVDVLIVNRVEAAMLSDVDVESRDGAFAAAPRLAAPGRSVIVTLGGGGLVVQPDGEPAFWLAPKPVKVVSTHGAGDCFVGTLATRLARGDDLRAAAEFANAAAAAHVSQ
jgi:ribokinase